MPNYAVGRDSGNINSHPSYSEAFRTGSGPYTTTYNGLERSNTGATDDDPEADDLRVHIHKYQSNLDKTLTTDNAKYEPLPNTLVLRNSEGDIRLNTVYASSLILEAPPDDGSGSGFQGSGTIFGGKF